MVLNIVLSERIKNRSINRFPADQFPIQRTESPTGLRSLRASVRAAKTS